MWLTRKNDPSARRGFTLLELLTVVMIMALLSMLALTSYFSAIRGMAQRGAGEHFINTLAQARQRACIDGTRVSVMAFNQLHSYSEENKPIFTPSYVVCRALGRISMVNGDVLFDEFNDLEQLFGVKTADEPFRIYNLSKGFWVNVQMVLSETYGGEANLFDTHAVFELDDYLNPTSYSREVFRFSDYALKVVSKSAAAEDWKVGDAYGVEVASPMNLPKTFYFNELGDAKGVSEGGNVADLKKIRYVTFGPDGRSIDDRSASRSVEFTIKSTDPHLKERRISIDGKGVISDKSR